jgi:hypothetical protein
MRMMKRGEIVRIGLALATILALSGLMVPYGTSAGGGTFICNETIASGVPPIYYPRTINANVDVPAGARCNLISVTVTGNLSVEGIFNGQNVTLEKNVTVTGGAYNTQLCLGWLCPPPRNQIQGNFTASHASSVVIDTTTFGGNVTIDGGTGETIMDFDSVNRNLAITNNVGEVWLNTVRGVKNLNCDGNAAPPSLTAVTAENANGQCSST